MGSEGYLVNQFLAARTNDRTDEWGGSASARMRFPVRIVERIRELAGDVPVIYRISLARPGRGRADLGRGRRARAAAGAGRGHRLQHRHRLARGAGADDHHPGAARGLGAVDGPAARGGRRPRHRLQPDQHPRAGRAAAGRRRRPTWCRWRARSSPTPTSSARRPRGAPTRSTPASPATRPASTTRSPTGPRPAWSTRAPATRPRWCSARPGVARRSRWWAPGRRGSSTAVAAAERGFPVTLFEAAPDLGGQFRLAMAVPGKEDFADTLRYYTRRLEVLGVDVRLSTRATRGRPGRVRRGRGRHRRRAAAPGPPGHRPPLRRVVRRGALGRGRARPAGGRDRRGRDRGRRLALADPRPGRHRRGLARPLGRRRPGGPPRRARRSPSRGRRSAR